MSKMSVTEQARYALTWQLAEKDQPPEIRAEMARLHLYDYGICTCKARHLTIFSII